MAKYKAYPDYKESRVEWLGEVPSHWNVAKTMRYFKIAMGQTILKEQLEDDGEWPVYSATEGDSYFGYVSSPQVKLGVGDLVIPARGNSIGSVKLVSGKSTTTQTTIYCKHLTQAIYPAFAYYFMLGNRKNLFWFTQTAIPQITVEEVGCNPILLPTYEEQGVIASFLDHETAKIDNLIERQQQLIELLKEKRQAVISHAVTKGLNPDVPMKDSGVEWLGEIPAHWTIPSLKYNISTRKGVAFKSSDFCDAGIRVVKASDIKKKTIISSDVFLPVCFSKEYPKAVLNFGDIVLSTVGSTPDVKNSAVGQLGYVPAELEGSLLNQNTVVFSSNSNTLEQFYLFLLLQTDIYRDHLDLHAHGTANQASLNVSDMLDFKYPCPSLSEQIEIVDYIQNCNSKFDVLETCSEEAIKYLQERRTALISAAVTGKIDVRDWVAPDTQDVEEPQEATA